MREREALLGHAAALGGHHARKGRLKSKSSDVDEDEDAMMILSDDHQEVDERRSGVALVSSKTTCAASSNCWMISFPSSIFQSSSRKVTVPKKTAIRDPDSNEDVLRLRR